MNKFCILLLAFFSLNLCAQDLIPYQQDGKWGFANSKGELIIKATFDSVGVFNRNRLLRKKVSIVKKNGAFNIINEQNVALFDYKLKLKYIDLSAGHIIVQRENNKFSAYDIFKYKLDSRTFDNYNSQTGYTLSIENNDKVGLIDYKLETIVPTEYDFISFQWFYSRGYESEEVIAAIAQKLNPTVLNNELYVNDEKVDFNRDMMILTVVNDKESKHILRYIDTVSDNEKFNEVDDEEDIQVPFSTIRSNVDRKKLQESIKEKQEYQSIKCDEDSGICVFSKNSKQGLYNLNTKKESELFSYIYPNSDYSYFEVTKGNYEGLMDASYEMLLPIDYQNIRIDYESGYIVYAKKDGGLYDYYNLKTKKYIYKDSEYKKGDYIYGGTSGGKFFFPVEKDGEFYYVDEDGFEYKNPN